MNKPNTFIVGAAKCGTTSLFHYLDQHPQVFMSEEKEPNYFSAKSIKDQGLYYNSKDVETLDEYLSLFKTAGKEKVLCEASVSYLFYPEVAEKIKEFDEDAKIIIILRSPIERAISHYKMDVRLGLVQLSLEEVLENKQSLHFQQYISLGYYATQVKRYLNTFNTKQVKIIFSQDLKNNRQSTLNEVYSFLDISSFQINHEQTHNDSGSGKNSFLRILYKQKWIRSLVKFLLPGSTLRNIKEKNFNKKVEINISSDLKQKLISLYKQDIIELEEILKKDLSSWYE